MMWLVVAMLALVVSTANAAELKCLTPPSGGTCICSEPFQATSYTQFGDSYNPVDSTNFQCSVEDAFTNSPVSFGSGHGPPTVRNDSTALNALPNKDPSTVQRYLSNGTAHGGSWNTGHGVSVSSTFQRVEARYYQWYTSDVGFKFTPATCNNSKVMSLDGVVGTFFGGDFDGAFHFYNFGFGNGTPSVDCCGSGTPMGPGANPPGVAQMRGNWWRHRWVMTNRGGPGFRAQHFMKNVTLNTPEVVSLDTASAPAPANYTPTRFQSSLVINSHRDGTCPGYYGFMYYIYMGWPTNAGQTVGAATEVEGGGGGGPTSVPATPTNLTVSPSSVGGLGLLILLALGLRRAFRA